MRPSGIRSFNYKDNLVRQHRRHFLVRIVLLFLVIIAVVVGAGYLLFFSQVFEVRGISLNGLNSLDGQFVYDQIKEMTENKTAGYLRTQKNILFFDGEALKASLLSREVALKDVQVKKKLFHDLVISVSERKPIGIWCFKNDSAELAPSCYYFDEDRITWGNVARSSGFLMLSIQDERNNEGRTIPEDFFVGIKKVSEDLSGPSSKIRINNILIPDDSFNEFRAYTDRNYYIVFALDSDLAHQLDVLKIFLDDKEKDPTFNPQYLDLRIDGRVYYR